MYDYYSDGLRITGIKILERLCGGKRQTDIQYRVLFECCGTEKVMTHAAVARRVSARSSVCAPCGRRRWAYFTTGDRVGGVTILNRTRTEGKAKTGAFYKIRYDCCGAERELSQYIIEKRNRNDAKACHSCSAKGSGLVRSGELLDYQDFDPDPDDAYWVRIRKKFDPRAPYGLDFRPEWKVPSWIPIGRHILWQDRMYFGL